MAEEFTAKFKIDISDLKKNISDANKAIKIANATFKSETAGMERWSKDADSLGKKLDQLKVVLENQKKILAAYQEQLKKQKSAYDENGKRADELREKLKSLAENGVSKTDEEYKKYQSALKSVLKDQENNSKSCDDLKFSILEQKGAISQTESQIERYSDAQKNLERESMSLTSAVDRQKKELSALKSEYIDIVASQGKNSDAANELAVKIDKLSGELRDNKSALDEAEKSADDLDKSLVDVKNAAADAANGGFSVMNGALASLVASGIKSAIKGLKNLATASYNAWKSYDEGVDIIIAATGATGEEANELQEVYENVARNVVADFSDIGAAVGEVRTRLGLTGKELQKISEKFLKFAELNKINVKSAIDVVQSAIAAFGLDASRAGDVLDLLNEASQQTGTSVESLASAMVSNAPALQEMGLSVSDAALFLANLSKSGVDASSVMSGMKKALANAAKEGKPLSTAMSEIEESIKNATSSTEAITTATKLFGAKAGPAIATAVRDGKLSFQDFGTSLEDFQGNIEETYDAIIDGPDKIALAMQNLKLESAKVFDTFLQQHGPKIESLVQNFTQNVLPKLTGILGKVLDGIVSITSNDAAITAITAAIGALIAAFAVKKLLAFASGIQKLLVTMKTLTAITKGQTVALAAQKATQIATTVATKAVTAAQWLWNAAMNANPIGALVVAIGGLIAGATALVSWLKSEEKAIKDVNQAQEDLTAAKEAARSAEESYIGAVDKATAAQDALKMAEKEAGVTGKSLYDQVAAGTLTYSNMTAKQRELYKAYLDNDEAQKALKISTDEMTAAKKAETIASFENDLALAKESDSYEAFKESIIDAYNQGVLSAEEARDLIGASMSEMSRSAQKTFMEDIPGDIRNGLDPKQYETTWQKLWKRFDEIWGSIKCGAVSAWEGIVQIWNTVSGWFDENVLRPLSKVFSTLWDSMKKGAYAAWDGIKKPFEAAANWFGKVFNNIKDVIKAPLNYVIRGLNKMIDGLNKISFDIPDWVPVIGGKKFGISISKIPELAKGGILKRGQVGLLEGNGAEAVVPLEKNKHWIRAVAADMLREIQGMAGVASVSTNNSKVSNFTQNIYAPKQPSRIELYRQTKNLLAMAEGGMI